MNELLNLNAKPRSGGKGKGCRALLIAITCMVAILALLVLPAQAQVTPTSTITIASGQAIGANGSWSNVVDVPQSGTFNLWVIMGCTNASGSNFLVAVKPADASTNIITDKAYNWAAVNGGTSKHVIHTNMGNYFLGVPKAVIYFTNGHGATLWLTNAFITR